MTDHSPDEAALRRRASDLCQSAFGAKSVAVASAPGRVNIIGEHVDYSGGWVLPVAIAKRTAVVGVPLDTPEVVIVSEWNRSDVVRVPLRDASSARGWSAYVAGAIAVLQELGGFTPRGCMLAVASDVPVGAGLSSSAAIEVATVMCGLMLSGRAGTMTPLQVAAAARRAEHEYAHVPCGIMDQYISACGKAGHALLIDCYDQSHRDVPFPVNAAIVVADTGVRHELGQSEYAARRAACESALAKIVCECGPRPTLRHCSAADLDAADLSAEERRCAGHAVSECRRTREFVTALVAGDLARCGRLMNESHESLRVDYRVSCRELDSVAAAAREQRGVYGARMTGAGFGGCIVAIADREVAAELETGLMARGAKSVLVTEPSAGASW
jgi:galactokinase